MHFAKHLSYLQVVKLSACQQNQRFQSSFPDLEWKQVKQSAQQGK